MSSCCSRMTRRWTCLCACARILNSCVLLGAMDGRGGRGGRNAAARAHGAAGSNALLEVMDVRGGVQGGRECTDALALHTHPILRCLAPSIALEKQILLELRRRLHLTVGAWNTMATAPRPPRLRVQSAAVLATSRGGLIQGHLTLTDCDDLHLWVCDGCHLCDCSRRSVAGSGHALECCWNFEEFKF